MGFSLLRFWLSFRSVFRFFVSIKVRFCGFCFYCGLRIFRFLAFGLRFLSKILLGFWIWYPLWFSVFPFWVPQFLFLLSGNFRLHAMQSIAAKPLFAYYRIIDIGDCNKIFLNLVYGSCFLSIFSTTKYLFSF